MHRIVFRLAAFLLVLFTTLTSASAAGIPTSGRMVFRAYGAPEGLEHMSLTCLAQDRSGFLWVGTEGGAYRYDGTAFRLWSLPEGLPSAWVRTFAAATDGNLWIGTRGGLCRLRDGHIHRVDSQDPLAHALISQIAEDSRGRIWVASQLGLFRNEGGTSGFRRIPEWPEGPAFSLARNGSSMWVGGPSLLRQMRDDGAITPWNTSQGVPDEPVKALLFSGVGDLWIRTPSQLRLLRCGADAITLPAAGLPPLAVSFYEENLAADGSGGLFVPTAKGLLHFPSTGGWRLLGEERGIPQGWTNQALVDAQGNLWLASLGLHLLQGNGSWQNYTHMDGLPGDTTWGLLRDRQGCLWISTSNGLARMDAQGLKTFPLGSGLVLYTLAEAADGSIWGAGEHPFLVRIAPDRQSVTRLPLPPSQGLAIPVALTFDERGSLWIATSNDGLWQLQDPMGNRRFQRAELPGQGELGQITALHLDGAKRLWACTGRGLARLDQQGWRMFGPEVGLHDAPLWALAPLPDGTVWLGYLEPFGLTHLDLSGATPKVLEHRSRKNGLASDSVYSLVADPTGALWVGGPRGVQRLSGATQRLFRREDGLVGTDCNPFSTWADADGSLWFGSTTGLLRHLPESNVGNTPAPGTVLLGLGLGRRTWDLPFMGSLDLGSVPYADHTLSARCTSLDFQQEDRLQFQARLLGLEEEWVSLRNRDLRYAALPPGKYELQVRTLIEGGQPGPMATARFQILSPWWSRWWMWIIALGLGHVVGRAGFRWRTRRLRRRNEDLQALVQERTQALELSNLAVETISTTDPLTSLRNRRYLSQELPAALALVTRNQRAGATGPDAALVFALLDIDHFKRINDTWNHEAGDRALKQIAEILRREARESDFLIRWGGEEILFVGRTADLDSASAVVDRLHQAIRERAFDLGVTHPVPLTCSIGFSVYPFQPDHLEATTWEDQVRLADRCLYAVKRSGRDSWLGVAGLPGAAPDLAQAFEANPAEVAASGAVALRAREERPLHWESYGQP
ncbi:ligand-binding sensor domain-containing diguanylate cyclase [Geothrix sp. PMB-07]|uniref:ligand-binding sensor domain-containing diguanylate cyclase n=1 Tax=Geothrix sp. PMB-07 TaxID=3068640 RepID=UPI00274127F5|nr:ligand-binding sensor domain-containing diguanylate cyclase [Geothrix sp. PMB-07]WLT29969.1 diguanylate cyclase [Geothrix sp. PMB-07]